jgi:mRNA interferase RelE/StbE
MSYSVAITRRAQGELSAVPEGAYERIRDALYGLSDDPQPPGCRRLTPEGGWCIQVGAYRILYEVDPGRGRVTVLHIGPRLDAQDRCSSANRLSGPAPL